MHASTFARVPLGPNSDNSTDSCRLCDQPKGQIARPPLRERDGDAKTKSPYSIVLFAALTVFFINIVIVIGPTPPGTGEIAFALGSTSSNATSPTSL